VQGFTTPRKPIARECRLRCCPSRAAQPQKLDPNLRGACQKLADSLREEITVTWEELDAAVSFRSAGVGRAELKVFEAVSRAVLSSASSFKLRRSPRHKH